MTENLAGRGEGLARLGDELNQCLQIIVTNAGNIVSFNAGAFRDEDIHGAALAIEKSVERAAKAIRAALEAAAPPSTPDLNDEIVLLDDELALADYHNAGFEQRAQLIEKAFLRVRRLRSSSVPVGEQKQEEGV